jgi:soluble lytic murein transglycosylase-like protein
MGRSGATDGAWVAKPGRLRLGPVDRLAIAVAGIADRMGRPWVAAVARRPRAAFAAAFGGVVLVVLTLPLGPRALVAAAYHHAVDELGVRLVEGHAEAIQRAASESGVSATLLAAVVYAESRGRGGQTSRAGALGLGQLVPAAASDAARRLGLPTPSDEAVRDDDELNLRLTAAHLAWLLEHSDGWPLEQVLVSYNAGRRKLAGWLEREGGFEAWARAEEARAARGEKTTGSLAYARQIVAIRERFRARGIVRDVDP